MFGMERSKGGGGPGLDHDQIHITPGDLQSELETLRSLRRRSLSQPSAEIDPDLPEAGSSESSPSLSSGASAYSHSHSGTGPHSVSTSATSSYHGHSPPNSPPRGAGATVKRLPSLGRGQVSVVLGNDGSGSPYGSFRGGANGSASTIDPDDIPLSASPQAGGSGGGGAGGAGGGGDLFWLPARLHPEIAPQEFKAFIKEATKPENLLRRSNSALGGGSLARKKSTLSRVYEPGVGDGVGEDTGGVRRQGSSGSTGVNRRTSMTRGLNGLESLTINDLQRLESIVDGTEFGEAIAATGGSRVGAGTGPRGEREGADGMGFAEREARIRAVMRRSMSLGGVGLTTDESSQEAAASEDDSPLISRGPGHIIRRSARTKVRKASLAGDGGGHRFPATRRTKTALAQSTSSVDDVAGQDEPFFERRISGQSVGSMNSDGGSDDYHTPGSSASISPANARVPLDDPSQRPPGPRPRLSGASSRDSRTDSVASNSSLLDAYVTDEPASMGDWPEDEGTASPSAPASPPTSPEKRRREGITPEIVASPPPPRGDSVQPPLQPDFGAKPQEGYLGVPPAAMGSIKPRRSRSPEDPSQEAGSDRRTPTPSPPLLQTNFTEEPQQASHGHSRPMASPVSGPMSAPPVAHHSPFGRHAAPQKEKKSAWAKLGLSEKSKKEKGKGKDKLADVVYEATRREKEREKEAKEAHGGFLSGLFGSGRSRKHEAEAEAAAVAAAAAQAARPTTAQAYLAQAQSAVQQPSPTSSAAWINGRFTNFYRLPIHVERAIYRLSHIKLANPRRPLYEQVLISNLMFWYLGVINKPQGQHGGPLTGQQAMAAAEAANGGPFYDDERPPVPSPSQHDYSQQHEAEDDEDPDAGRRRSEHQKRGLGRQSPTEDDAREPRPSHHVSRPTSHPAPQASANRDDNTRRSAPPTVREYPPDDEGGFEDANDDDPDGHATPVPISGKRSPVGTAGGFEVVTRHRSAGSDSAVGEFGHAMPGPNAQTDRAGKRTSPPESSWMSSGHQTHGDPVDEPAYHHRPEGPRQPNVPDGGARPRDGKQMYQAQQYQPPAPVSPKRERNSSLPAGAAPPSPERPRNLYVRTSDEGAGMVPLQQRSPANYGPSGPRPPTKRPGGGPASAGPRTSREGRQHQEAW